MYEDGGHHSNVVSEVENCWAARVDEEQVESRKWII